MRVLTNNDRMGRNILTLRQKYNLSQEEFAGLVGLDTAQLDALERGIEREVDADVLFGIHRHFGVDVYTLIEDWV